MPSEFSKPESEFLRAGHYARKQVFCKDWLIAWSHQRRFELGLKLARAYAGRRVLDYGCGDGTFLALLLSSAAQSISVVGAEIDSAQVDDCRARFINHPEARFCLVDELAEDYHTGVYDVVFCMEVLEHVINLGPVLDRLHRLVAPSGVLLVSVPVETGLPLLIKQTFRRIAGWRRLGDYRWTSRYRLGELIRGVFAGRRQHIVRPVHGEGFYDHKGFNWKVLETRMRERFELERRIASPVACVGPALGSQVWFVLRKSR